MHTWQAQEAKAKFSQLLDECQKEPQCVTRHGEAAAYIISAEQYDNLLHKKTGKKKTTVGEFFRNSSLYASGIKLDLRRKYGNNSHRDLDFDTDASS